MSGTASRYIGGVPYGPGMGVGRYPNAASLMQDFAPTFQGTSVRPVTDAAGAAVNPLAGLVQEVPAMGLGNMLLSAALGVAPYAGDIASAAERLFSPGQQPSLEAIDPTPLSDIPPAVQRFTPNWAPTALDAIDPTPLTDIPPPSTNAPAAPSGSPQGAPPVQGGSFLGLPVESGLEGSLGTLGGYDVFTSGLSAGAGLAGGFAGGTLARRGSEGNASIGGTLGATIGGLIGGPIAPITAFLGGLAGAGIGGQIGPRPTIGANFSTTAQFNPDGSLAFRGFGGDNGGTVADAQGFASGFGNNLLTAAAAQGLRFNPNMAGVQFNIGGFDNPSRTGTAPGGYFYDPYLGGSPENYALRPNPGMDAYSPMQEGAFTNAVLADLAARDVFTPTGQGRGMDFYQSSLGAPLGGYGYTTFQNGGFTGMDGFGDILAQRQAEIGGWQAGAQQRAAENAQMIADRDAGYAAQVVNVN